MFLQLQLLLLLLASLGQTNALQHTPPPPPPLTTRLSTVALNRNTNRPIGKIVIANSSTIQPEKDQKPAISSAETTNNEAATDELKNEIFVNDLLEKPEGQAVIPVPELHRGPHYELNWSFTDKDTIRVTFDLFSVPTSLIENNIYSDPNQRTYSLLAIMASMPTRPLKSITSLEYYVYIIRPYTSSREIILKMEKLHIKNTTLKPNPHFSNALSLTALNHHEKYSVCISYYQTNISTKAPDLLLCQDIINDYSKFAQLKTDPKHGLLFITTQYSIIIALLVVLQSVFTMRKRRIAQVIARHVSNKAHSIRSTLSSVSLGRQSFSSIDASAEHHQQQHAASNHAVHREPTIDEEGKIKKRIISSPAIVLSEPSITMDNSTASADESEPFLKRVSSKNHVHFLLGPGEEGDDAGNEDLEPNALLNSHTVPTNKEPYSDQSDALLSMAHILDTNKPWSRHGQQTSPV